MVLENTVNTNEENRRLLSSIEDILEDVALGKPVIIVDDENRENEGDLIVAAEKVTAQNINFMAKEGRGLICLPMERSMIERLGLPLMGAGNNSQHRTAFTVSIEAKEGVTTGISASDRAHTIKTAIDANSTEADIATPGHVFPLKARDGGVLERAGHTEAAVDLAKLAGFSGAGVICEIMNDDGSMARLDDLATYAQKHDLKIGSIADLIAYRSQKETHIRCLYEGDFQSNFSGDAMEVSRLEDSSQEGSVFTMRIYEDVLHGGEHIVLIKGAKSSSNVEPLPHLGNNSNNKSKSNSNKEGGGIFVPSSLSWDGPVHVRMHALNEFQDVLGEVDVASSSASPSQSASTIIQKSLKILSSEQSGVFVLLRNSHRNSLSKRLLNTKEKDAGENKASNNKESVPLRNYGVGAQILRDLGIRDMILLTNSPKPVIGLEGYDLHIASYKPID